MADSFTAGPVTRCVPPSGNGNSGNRPRTAVCGWVRHYRTAFANALFAVVEQDGIPIGRFYGWHGPEHSVLIEITLPPPWRGQGLGSDLVARFVEEAGQRVTLHVEESDPARRLYERFGFQPTGESNGPHIKTARE
ncbi:MAG: GNAT family N-acetyltransferase [Acidobacteria bacterium]|nr:GNAT family N-acetyltransferase [Acidobacteriota bacterium]